LPIRSSSLAALLSAALRHAVVEALSSAGATEETPWRFATLGDVIERLALALRLLFARGPFARDGDGGRALASRWGGLPGLTSPGNYVGVDCLARASSTIGRSPPRRPIAMTTAAASLPSGNQTSADHGGRLMS
jgi:hypothetical protein